MRGFGVTLRAGCSVRGLWMTLPLLAVLPAVGGALLPSRSRPDWDDGPLTCRVLRGDFVHEVSAKGSVESAENVEVRCDVSIAGFSRTKILELVEEGTYVQPGDFLARLDAAPLEKMRTEQQILCFTRQASLTQAEKTYALAKVAKEQYSEGTYRQQKQSLEAAVVVATEKHRRVEAYCKDSRRLYDLGYITQRELEANEFAVRKARLELDLAQTRLDVLEKYTWPRMEKELDCDVTSRRARLDAARFLYQRDSQRLALLETQIKHCLITAPAAGHVVYAHVYHSSRTDLIAEGTELYRNQVIFRLPNPKRMQVKATVPESKVALVEKGMPATVQFEAFPGVELTGKVQKVEPFPEPVSYFGPSVKQFETIIALDNYDLDLRPGLTANVKIRVQQLPDQLLIPTQAVLKHGDKDYCLTCDAGRWQAHEVKVGATDGRYVVIRKGLREGRRVVLGTAAHRDEVQWPKTGRET